MLSAGQPAVGHQEIIEGISSHAATQPAQNSKMDAPTNVSKPARGKVMARRARGEPSHSGDVELALVILKALELHDVAGMPTTKKSALHGSGSGRPRAMGCAQACATAQWSPCAQARSPQRATRARPWSPTASDRSKRSEPM